MKKQKTYLGMLLIAAIVIGAIFVLAGVFQGGSTATDPTGASFFAATGAKRLTRSRPQPTRPAWVQLHLDHDLRLHGLLLPVRLRHGGNRLLPLQERRAHHHHELHGFPGRRDRLFPGRLRPADGRLRRRCRPGLRRRRAERAGVDPRSGRHPGLQGLRPDRHL